MFDRFRRKKESENDFELNEKEAIDIEKKRKEAEQADPSYYTVIDALSRERIKRADSLTAVNKIMDGYDTLAESKRRFDKSWKRPFSY
jgi:phosphoglycerate dehydrogenase-like enzyme